MQKYGEKQEAGKNIQKVWQSVNQMRKEQGLQKESQNNSNLCAAIVESLDSWKPFQRN